ncbi:MAG TPA: hypothetical protein VGM81_07985 [Burkholderiaceae bacterium]|jgi:hypothetical protein
MPNFAYTARLGDEIHSGLQEGASAVAVASLLQGRGLTPVTIAVSDKRAPGAAISAVIKPESLLTRWTEHKVNGHGALTITPPARAGSFSLAPNLGAGTSSSACVATPSASISANAPGATLAWLRSQYGAASTNASACPGGSWGSDPSARASFGISSPETQRNIRVTEMQ